MRELSNIEIEQVNGGVIPAFLAGVALGKLAKQYYLKYK
tara:strand:+ start:166 stop:282 length:117 start_codon:yes stop_codon:yes gene_type:complete